MDGHGKERWARSLRRVASTDKIREEDAMSERQRERATKQEVDGHAGSSSVAAPRGAGVERALARTSDAPLREGNTLALLKNGPDTYEDWLAAIGRARHWGHLVVLEDVVVEMNPVPRAPYGCEPVLVGVGAVL